MMTFSELNTAITEEMQLDPGLVSDAERRRFINDFLNKVGNLQLLEKVYEEASVSTQYVDFPSDFSKLKRLYWYDGSVYTLLEPVQDDAAFNSSGKPVGYNIEGNQVRLYPSPSSSGTLRWIYNYLPAEFTTSNEGDTPDIPQAWDGTIVDYACYRSHRKNGNQVASLQYYRDFKESIGDCIRSYIARLNSKVYSSVEEGTVVTDSDTFIPRW